MDISTVKNYLRVDHDDDDDLIALMMDVAEEYITNAVGSCDLTKSRVKLVYLAAVQDLYDNRVLISSSSQGYAVTANFTHMIQSLVAQLSVEELIEAEG